jgi:hypothetical protein
VSRAPCAVMPRSAILAAYMLGCEVGLGSRIATTRLRRNDKRGRLRVSSANALRNHLCDKRINRCWYSYASRSLLPDRPAPRGLGGTGANVPAAALLPHRHQEAEAMSTVLR